MALEIAAVQRDLPRDFVEAYIDRTGELPLSVIRRETLIVDGVVPRATACKIFLEDGERLGEDEWRKVIYHPPLSNGGVHEATFLNFAQGYIYAVTPARRSGKRQLKKEYYVEGNILTDRGRPYIRASFDSERQITRMELGYRKEQPLFEVVDGTEPIIFRTRRSFWEKRGK